MRPDISISATLETLAKHIKEGDRAAEELLFARLRRRFATTIRQKIHRRADADDLAQEACLIVLQKYRSTVFTRGFEPWAIGILRNVLRRYYSRLSDEALQMRVALYATDALTPSGNGADPSLKRRFISGLRHLARTNQRYARAVCLSSQGFSAKEIAGRLGTTPNNVYTILSRGRACLRSYLEQREIRS